MRVVKAQARRRGSAVSPEPSLLAYATCTCTKPHELAHILKCFPLCDACIFKESILKSFCKHGQLNKRVLLGIAWLEHGFSINPRRN